MRAAARTTIRPDTASVNILAGSKHRFKNQQTIHSLNSMRRTATMCRTSYLQDRFAPYGQVFPYVAVDLYDSDRHRNVRSDR